MNGSHANIDDHSTRTALRLHVQYNIGDTVHALIDGYVIDHA